MDSIINFSSFLKGRNSQDSPILENYDEENEFPMSSDSQEETDSDIEYMNEPYNPIAEFESDDEDENPNYEGDPIRMPSFDSGSDIDQDSDEDEEYEEEEITVPPTPDSGKDYYNVFRDRNENFSCDISLEGASLGNTQARLILETKDWNLLFEGKIDSNGKCTIPIKKLSILNEGATGNIRLEVIADDTVFTPWEDEFKVKVSKKVAVKVHESRSNPRRKTTGKSVKVKVNRR